MMDTRESQHRVKQINFDVVDEFVLKPEIYLHMGLELSIKTMHAGMESNKPPELNFLMFILAVDRLQSIVVSTGKMPEEELKNKDSEFNKKIADFKVGLESERNEDTYKKYPSLYGVKIANLRLQLLMEKIFEGRTVEPVMQV